MAAAQPPSPQQQILEIKLQGLYTNPNNLSQVPAGSMSQADNVVLSKPGIIESRRGQQVYGSTFASAPDKMFNYRESLLSHTSDGKLSYDSDGFGNWVPYAGTYLPPSTAINIHSVEQNKNFYFTSSTGIKKLDAVIDVVTPAGAPAGLGGTGVLTGTTGFFPSGTNVAYEVVWGYTDENNNLILGAPSPAIQVSNTTIDITGNLAITTNTILLASSIAGITAGMLISGVGIPVGTTVVSAVGTTITMSANATATNTLVPLVFGYNTNVTLTFVIPANVDTTWFYQVYRAPFSANLTSSPGVEYAQVLQNTLTSTDLTNGYITVLDDTPVDLTTTLLYTNPSQLGAAAANYQPPIAADMCEYLGYTFYANTIQKNSLNLTLLGAGNGTAFSYVTVTGTTNSTTSITGLSTTANLRVGQLVIGAGIPANTTIVSINTGASSMVISQAATASATVSLECEDGITLNGVTYWGSSAPTLPTQFLVTVNPLDPATAITNTANALINCINLHGNLTAFYQSGYVGLPGLILLQEVNIGGATFYATSTNGASFNPVLPSSGTTIASDNSANGNYLWYSSFNQPEAVPLAQFIPIGSADYPIKRILALRTSVMIFKDDGIFRLFGTTPSQFQVFLLDSTTLLLAPESAVNFNNQVYFASLQGLASLSDNATPVIISIPIDDVYNQISVMPGFINNSFGVSYESDRTYLFGSITTATDTTATQIFAYNYVTQAWTRWPITRSCGIVSVPNSSGTGDLLYMGNPTSKQIYQERKSFTAADYTDEQYTINITSFSGFTVNLTSSANAKIGQTISQGGFTALVTSVVNGTQITVDSYYGWANGTAYLYNPILNSVTWNPFSGDNPGMVKHFREASFFFRNAAFNTMVVSFSSDFSSPVQTSLMSPVSQYSWGLPPWGSFPWGGKLGGMQSIRAYVNVNQSRAHWLNVGLTSNQAFTSFSLQGISLITETISERFR
jgi:hypothetical protein